jgi:hypothetical protein
MALHAGRMREINVSRSLVGKYLLERMTEGWEDNNMLDLKREIGCEDKR